MSGRKTCWGGSTAELRFLRHLSQKTGLGLNFLCKEEKISVLLRQLSEVFEENVVLKGGTPISRIYLSKIGKARFSEDLDFDFISKDSFKEKIGILCKIMEKTSGFDVQRPRIQYRTVRFDCYFVNELGSKDRVMVDFNVGNECVSRGEDPKMTLVEPVFVPSVSANLRVYSLEDIVTRKFGALNGRQEGKDIYDTFYLLDIKPDTAKLLKSISAMLIHDKIDKMPDEFVKDLAVSVEKMSAVSRNIGKATNHYIPTNLRPTWNEFIPTLSEKVKTCLGK
jgi:hypothetical protein